MKSTGRALAAIMLAAIIALSGCGPKKSRGMSAMDTLEADVCNGNTGAKRTREMAGFTARLTYDAAREAGALYDSMTLDEYIKTTRDAMGRDAGVPFAACEARQQPIACEKTVNEIARAYKVKENRVTSIMKKLGVDKCAYLTRTATAKETNEQITVKFLAGEIKGRMQLLAPVSSIEKNTP